MRVRTSQPFPTKCLEGMSSGRALVIMRGVKIARSCCFKVQSPRNLGSLPTSSQLILRGCYCFHGTHHSLTMGPCGHGCTFACLYSSCSRTSVYQTHCNEDFCKMDAQTLNMWRTKNFISTSTLRSQCSRYTEVLLFRKCLVTRLLSGFLLTTCNSTNRGCYGHVHTHACVS